MNQNLFKAIIACGIVCFIACTTTKKPKSGVNAWHVPK